MFLQETMFDATEALIDYAESRNRTILELGLSWLAELPEIPSVIAGATTPEQVKRISLHVHGLSVMRTRDFDQLNSL